MHQSVAKGRKKSVRKDLTEVRIRASHRYEIQIFELFFWLSKKASWLALLYEEKSVQKCKQLEQRRLALIHKCDSHP